jgi:BMFP domain-containing protein YqiC
MIEVETIQAHYRRQASPEVWAEVDALRERVAELEARLAALQALAPSLASAIESPTAEGGDAPDIHP